MTLPASRDVNYSPGATPVSGANLNNIQDCFVGKKYASSPIFLSGIDFQLDAGTATRAGHVWTFPTSGLNRIVAAIRFWPGTRLTNLVWSFNRNSNNLSGEFDFLVTRRSFGDGGVTTSSVTSGIVSGGTGWTTHDSQADGGLPHNTLDGFLYLLSLTSTTTFSGAPSFDGVKIVADRL